MRIEIGHPGEAGPRPLGLVRDPAHSLEHALVIETPDEDTSSLLQHLGRVSAELLAEILGPDDVLGLAWARSVSAMAGSLRSLPRIPVVQPPGP